jgi:3-deoxy-D-manno-octulosonic-acid transferase
MFNFREVAGMFVEREAAVQVKDGTELGMTIAELLNDRSRRERMGANAVRVIQENAGAVSRTADVIGKYIQGSN